MNKKRMLYIGGVGTAVTAICCLTPVLVILLGTIGLSAWVGGLDYVLFPLLIFFIGVTAFALIRKRERSSESHPAPHEERQAE
jgi:mercuric ion transport protein